MKLMYGPLSPFARKVRVAAIELGLAERIELSATEVAPGRANAAYADAVNPLRKIPALVLDDGKSVLMDSTVICEYLDALAGGGRLIPPAGPERWRVLTQHAVAQGMTDAIILVRYETFLRPEPMRWPTWIDDQWDKVLAGIGWFESRAATALKPAAGAPDLSQIALACCLGYVDFRYPERDWPRRFPKVAAWRDSIATRHSFAETKPQNPPRS